MKHVMGTLLPQTGRMQVARPLLKLVSQWCNRLCGLAKHPSELATFHVSTEFIKSVHASCCIWLLHLVNCYAATKVRCTLPSCRMLLCGSFAVARHSQPGSMLYPMSVACRHAFVQLCLTASSCGVGHDALSGQVTLRATSTQTTIANLDNVQLLSDI